MDTAVFDDELSIIGTGVGVYLALAGVASLVGMPWQYGTSSVAAAGQIVGALALIALGVGLARLVTQ
ncbi:MAG: hypothetical protein ABEJ68_11085 [Halobacteriaceae archaeon]